MGAFEDCGFDQGAVLTIFAIDTSLKNITLAIIKDQRILASHNSVPEESQSVVIMRVVDDIFSQAKLAVSDINTVLFCVGPGSFTSLRVGLATVQGLFLKSGAKLLTTSSLLLRCASSLDSMDAVDRMDGKSEFCFSCAPLGRERMAVGLFGESMPKEMPQHLQKLFTQRLTSCPLYHEGCVRGENLTEMNQIFPVFAALVPDDMSQTKPDAFLTILEKKWFEESRFETAQLFYMIEPDVGQKSQG